LSAENRRTKQLAEVSMLLSSAKGAEMQLQAWKTPLSVILDKISQVVNIPIHYSVLPKGEVAATCVNSTVKGILQCLLGPDISLAFRYSKGVEVSPFSQRVSEIWVLGSSLDATQINMHCTELVVPTVKESGAIQTGNADLIKLEQLLVRVNVKDDDQRALAVAKLATKAVADNDRVTEALLQALDDPSTKVRMQALFGWVYREGDAAVPELMRALNDPDPAVRLKAVGLGNDLMLLNQAASDPNEKVRAYALMKLQAKVKKTDR